MACVASRYIIWLVAGDFVVVVIGCDDIIWDDLVVALFDITERSY